MKFIFTYPVKLIRFLFYYSVYVVLWKNIIKRFIRMCLGTHEIQRNVKTYNSFEKLKQCILWSRDLYTIHNYFTNNNRIYTNEEIATLLSIIKNRKHIQETNFFTRFKSILTEHNQLIKHKTQLAKLYSEKVDCKDHAHQEILFDLWKMLKNNRDIQIQDKKWRFQGIDPSTDFRGAGMLGLKNLHYFVKYHREDAEKVYAVATDSKTWYFFSASAINVTGKIIEMIEAGKLDQHLKQFSGDMLTFTHMVFHLLFTKFNERWVELGVTDFMRFNTIFEEFIDTNAKLLVDENLFKNKDNKIY